MKTTTAKDRRQFVHVSKMNNKKNSFKTIRTESSVQNV